MHVDIKYMQVIQTYVYSQGCSIVYIAVAMSKMADLVCKINEKTCKLKEMVLEKCVT